MLSHICNTTRYLGSFSFPVIHVVDSTVTKILPGLLLDRFLPKPTEKKLKSLIKWGNSNGNEELKNVKSLQSKRWYLYPIEYRKTSLIASARKTYYWAAIQSRKQKSVADLAKEIRGLVRTHYNKTENDDGLLLDGVETESLKILNEYAFEPSFWDSMRNLYRNYPHSHVGHYTALGVRCLALFTFLSPKNSVLTSAACTAVSLYFWTILLTPGARKDLEKIRAPANRKENFLHEDALSEIQGYVTEQIEENRAFQDALSQLQFRDSIEDPFPVIFDRQYFIDRTDKIKNLRGKDETKSTWFKFDWQLRNSMIERYEQFNSDTKKEMQINLRKANWIRWLGLNHKEAKAFIEKQTDVPEEEWKNWIPKKQEFKIIDTT